MMLYELSADGQTVGVFPTEAAARHNAAYMPGGATLSANGPETAIF